MEASIKQELSIDSVRSRLIAERYELKEELGRGGCSIVYRALDLVLERSVAIKILRTGRLNQRAILRFQQEARFIAKLNHKSILRVLDFGMNGNGVPYMTTELVDGFSLADLIQSPAQLSSGQIIELLVDLASAFAHAHSNGVIHRDIKPANILLDFRGDEFIAKVIDFSVSKLMQNLQEERWFTTSQLIGSPTYMSPEQIRDEELEPTSDIYSFGCVMYELVAGVPPFQAESAMEIFEKHAYQSPPDLTAKLEERKIPGELGLIILKCLEKDKRNRFQSMETVRDALQSLLNSKSEVADRLEASAVKQIVEAGSEAQKRLKFMERAGEVQLSAWLAMGCISLVLLGMIAAYLVRGDEISVYTRSFADADLGIPEPPNGAVQATYSKHFRPDKKNLNMARSIFLDDSSMRAIVDMPLLERINACSTAISDRSLCYMKDLKLKELKLAETTISSQGLKYLAGQSRLRSLDLSSNTITSSGVAHLARLPSLKMLYLRATDVDDSCGIHLRRLKLEALDLDSTSVSDEILPELAQIKTLRRLSLRKCKRVTAGGIARMRSQLPKCEILFSSD